MTSTDVFRAKAPLAMRRLMREFGFNKFRAAAIMGNAGHESGGLATLQEANPVVRGSRGGYGWFQWTGPRRRAFEAWCAANRLAPASDEANLGFLISELRGPESAALSRLRAAETLEDMVVAFEQAYERAGVKHYAPRLRWARRALLAFDAAPDANPKPLRRSRTMGGAATAATGAGGAAVVLSTAKQAVETAGEARETISAARDAASGVPVSWLIWAALALALIGLAVVVYARWDDAGRPLPWRGDA